MAFYRNIYPRTWHTIRNNMSLLFFGMFASLLGFHEVKLLFNLTDTTPDFISSSLLAWLKLSFSFSTATFTSADIPGLLSLLGIFILFAIAVILAVASQGALIHFSVTTNQPKTKTSLSEKLSIGLEKFWPLLGINIINALIGYFFLVLVISPLITFLASSNEWLTYIIIALVTFFILLPLVIIISFVTRYGATYVVLKNQKLMDAFSNSWALFKVNWVITIENALLMILLTVLYFVVIFSGLVFIFAPFFILSLFLSSSPALFWFIILIGALLVTLVFIAVTSLYGAYYNMVWANVWLELTKKGKSYSKTHRLAHKHLPRLTK